LLDDQWPYRRGELGIDGVDFHEVERLQHAGNWEGAGELLANAARSLESAGADFLVLCTNTMHKIAPAIESAVAIPLFHIADPAALAIKDAGFAKVGLLGTRFTMEQDFYRERLGERHGLLVVIPTPEDRQIVHRVIYEELCLGKVVASSRAEYPTQQAFMLARQRNGRFQRPKKAGRIWCCPRGFHQACRPGRGA
jgi:aspartate racemase